VFSYDDSAVCFPKRPFKKLVMALSQCEFAFWKNQFIYWLILIMKISGDSIRYSGLYLNEKAQPEITESNPSETNRSYAIPDNVAVMYTSNEFPHIISNSQNSVAIAELPGTTATAGEWGRAKAVGEGASAYALYSKNSEVTVQQKAEGYISGGRGLAEGGVLYVDKTGNGVAVGSGSIIYTKKGGTGDVYAGATGIAQEAGDLTIHDKGTAEVWAKGHANIKEGGEATVKERGSAHIQGGTGIIEFAGKGILESGYVVIYDGGHVEVTGKGEACIQKGGTLNVGEGAAITIRAAADVPIRQGDKEVITTINSEGTIRISHGATLTLEHGSNVQLVYEAGTKFTVRDGEPVTVEDGTEATAINNTVIARNAGIATASPTGISVALDKGRAYAFGQNAEARAESGGIAIAEDGANAYALCKDSIAVAEKGGNAFGDDEAEVIAKTGGHIDLRGQAAGTTEPYSTVYTQSSKEFTASKDVMVIAGAGSHVKGQEGSIIIALNGSNFTGDPGCIIYQMPNSTNKRSFFSRGATIYKMEKPFFNTTLDYSMDTLRKGNSHGARNILFSTYKTPLTEVKPLKPIINGNSIND
jgi:hypothetical protein